MERKLRPQLQRIEFFVFANILFCLIVATISEELGNPDCPGCCFLPPDAGPCLAFMERYYFDLNEYRCKKFVYGGCDGNSNNFKAEEECIKFSRKCEACNPYNYNN